MNRIEQNIIENVIRILAEKDHITVSEQVKMLAILRKKGED